MFPATMPPPSTGARPPVQGHRRSARASRRLLALAAVFAAALAGCWTPIRHGLEEPAANEVMAALERVGIAAEKVRDEGVGAGGFVVRVPDEDAVRALDLLHTLGLPRGRRSGFAEVYAQPSLVPTSTEERARYLQALSGEIDRTLESVDGVVEARVHLVMAEVDPLAVDGKPRVPAQAAVLLKGRAGLALKEADVQKLVAGSVPGLSPPAVAVVLAPVPETAAATLPPLEVVGPLRMAPGSRPLLLATLGGAVALITLLALLLLLTARRLATAERRLAAPAALRLAGPDTPESAH
jgi:type III secretion protein J